MPSGSLVITLSTVHSDSVRHVLRHSNMSYHFLQATTLLCIILHNLPAHTILFIYCCDCRVLSWWPAGPFNYILGQVAICWYPENIDKVTPRLIIKISWTRLGWDPEQRMLEDSSSLFSELGLVMTTGHQHWLTEQGDLRREPLPPPADRSANH